MELAVFEQVMFSHKGQQRCAAGRAQFGTIKAVAVADKHGGFLLGNVLAAEITVGGGHRGRGVGIKIKVTKRNLS